MRRGLPEELMFLRNRKAPQKRSAAALEGKVCVITGATSGIGLETLRRFIRAGARPVMLCRDPDKAQAVRRLQADAGGEPADIVIADFSRLDSVRRAAETILRRHPRIDLLINNAGMHSTTLGFTPEGLETVLCVNHLAPFLLTQLLLPRLRESAPARILFVNSEGHRFSGFDPDDIRWTRRHYTGLKGYGASKTAQLLTVWELAERLTGSGVTVNALHPGDVKTGIGGNNGPLYRFFTRHVTALFLKDPSISAEAIFYLAADPALKDVNGRFFHLTVEEKPAAHALDRALGQRVWDLSLRLTGLPGA